MKWESASGIFKVLIGVIIPLVVAYLRKHSKPAVKNFTKFMKILDSIDAEKRANVLEKSLRKAMLDTSRDPIFTTNEKGEVTYVNSAFVKMIGAPDHRDAHGFGDIDFVYKEDQEKVSAKRRGVISRSNSWEAIIRYVNQQNGNIITTECRSGLYFGWNEKDEEILFGSFVRLSIIKVEESK